MLQQAGPPLGAGIGHVRETRKNGILGLIPYE
jgi:hypothetical protein